MGAKVEACIEIHVMIYLIRHQPTGYLKVGYSGDPRARISSMRTAYPNRNDLELLACFSGDVSVERTLHRRFRVEAVTARSEWYPPNVESALRDALGPEITMALPSPWQSRTRSFQERQTMTATEFRKILTAINLTVAEAALRLARDPSTVYRWLRGEVEIPQLVQNIVCAWRSE